MASRGCSSAPLGGAASVQGPALCLQGTFAPACGRGLLGSGGLPGGGDPSLLGTPFEGGLCLPSRVWVGAGQVHGSDFTEPFVLVGPPPPAPPPRPQPLSKGLSGGPLLGDPPPAQPPSAVYLLSTVSCLPSPVHLAQDWGRPAAGHWVKQAPVAPSSPGSWILEE